MRRKTSASGKCGILRGESIAHIELVRSRRIDPNCLVIVIYSFAEHWSDASPMHLDRVIPISTARERSTGFSLLAYPLKDRKRCADGLDAVMVGAEVGSAMVQQLLKVGGIRSHNYVQS